MANTRMTNQRLKILDYLKSVCCHPTAEKVFAHVKKDLPQITLATVYRNLNLMASQGLILKLEIDKEYHYDACIGKHQHCICERCGQIEDLHQPELTEHALHNMKAKGFKPEAAIIMFRGLCNKCSEVNN